MRRLIILVVGFTVLLIGLALIVLPGPAIIVIPVGLAILATEFIWARNLLKEVRRGTSKLGSAVLGGLRFGRRRTNSELSKDKK